MNMAKTIRITLAAFILLAIFISVPPTSEVTGDAGTPVFAAKIAQGNLALLRFDAPQGVDAGIKELQGRLNNKEMSFFKDPGKNSFYSLVSAPLEMEQSIRLVEIETLEDQAGEALTQAP